jgi:hypothetical protein
VELIWGDNMHSKNYGKISGYYRNGLWDIKKVWSVVGKPFGITELEYRQITGLVYEK